LSLADGIHGPQSDQELVRRKSQCWRSPRHGSEHKLPHGCKVIPGDALDKNSFVLQIPPAETFVQLIGRNAPESGKEDEFRSVDLGSAGVDRCGARGRRPPFRVRQRGAGRSVMKFYLEVRAEAEKMIRESGMNATFCGPGTSWGPPALAHFSKTDVLVLERVPATRESAQGSAWSRSSRWSAPLSIDRKSRTRGTGFLAFQRFAETV